LVFPASDSWAMARFWGFHLSSKLQGLPLVIYIYIYLYLIIKYARVPWFGSSRVRFMGHGPILGIPPFIEITRTAIGNLYLYLYLYLYLIIKYARVPWFGSSRVRFMGHGPILGIPPFVEITRTATGK
jgi:hypothetical protein